MNFVEMKAELAERGFDHLSQQRLGQYINRGRARLDNAYRWPYLATSTSGVPPVIISDLGQIRAVVDMTNDSVLEESTFEELLDSYPDLSTTGTAQFWYPLSGGALVTYPVGTASLTVFYWKRSPLLTETDTPLAPSDYHMLYVDIAQAMAYRDSDNHQAAEAMQVDIDRQIAEMVASLLSQNEQQFVKITYASEDW